MSDVTEIMSLLGGAAVGGCAFGMLCSFGSRFTVDILEKLQSGAADLAVMRYRTAVGSKLLGGFRQKNQATKRILDDLDRSVRKLESSIESMKHEERAFLRKPMPILRMLGDERAGHCCFGAEITNRLAAKTKDIRGENWASRDFETKAIAVVWSDSRAEARAKLESAYPYGDGFAIGRVFEFNDVTGAGS